MALNSILSVYELAANKQLALAHPFTPLRKQPLIPELITSLTQAGMRGVMPSPCVSSNPAASLSLVPSQRRSLYLQIKQAGGHSLLPTLGKHQFSGILLFLQPTDQTLRVSPWSAQAWGCPPRGTENQIWSAQSSFAAIHGAFF